MSTSLETLPDELKLEIYQYLPSLFNLALTNRRSLQTTAVHLVQRAETPDSVPEAFRAIQYIIRFGNLPVSYLLNTSFEPFFSRFSDHVIDSLQNGSFEKAEAMLQALKQLPLQEHIPAEHLLKVFETAGRIIAQAIKGEDFGKAKTTLEIMKQQPCTTIMPEDFCLAPLNQIKEQIIRIIHDGTNLNQHLRKAEEALQFIKTIPSDAKVPKDFFVDVVKTGRDIILQAFREEQLRFGSLYVANQVARIMMLFNMVIPKNYFLEIIERGQHIICHTTKISTRELTRGILQTLTKPDHHSRKLLPRNYRKRPGMMSSARWRRF